MALRDNQNGGEWVENVNKVHASETNKVNRSKTQVQEN